MVEALLRDSAYSFIDNINTPNLETTADVVMAAFKKTIPVVSKAEADRYTGMVQI